MKIHNSRISKIFEISVLAILLMFSIHTIAIETSNNLEMLDDFPYDGHLRIYIVEPESRWSDYDGVPYHFGFLDYVFDDTISIDYLNTYEDTLTWSGDVVEDNVMVMAAIFNSQANLGYSNPPSDKPFEAYAVDASTSAAPGNTGYNTVTEDFTHTVFIEEGTVNWCPDCPAMAEVLSNIYETEDYPFIYVALIGDMNPIAEPRYLDDYNLWGYPTGYFDGGKEVLVGGILDEEPYRTKIEASGQRDVHELNLSLSVEWIGNGELEIDISITNNEEITGPIFEFGDFSGGLMGVSTTVRNVGTEDSTDVEWSILVKGGLLKLIDKSTEGTIDNLAINDEMQLKSKRSIIGIGNVDIVALANDVAKVEKGFIIGPFIVISK